MNNVLITGGAGFIGVHLTKQLAHLGYRVRVLDCFDREVHEYGASSFTDRINGVEYIIGDVRDPETLEQALTGINVVYHLAAKTSVPASMERPEEFLQHNTIGTSVLSRLSRGQVRRVILASSRAVYGEGRATCYECGEVSLPPRSNPRIVALQWEPICPICNNEVTVAPCSEKITPFPASIYGLSKLIQEQTLELLLSGSSTELVVLRYFNVYGAGQSLCNSHQVGVVSAFVRQALADQPFEFYEDGQQIRDLIHVKDIVSANVKALSCPPGVYNIGSGRAISLYQLTKTIALILKKPMRYMINNQVRSGDIRHSLADISIAKQILAWEPQVPLYEGIEGLARWQSCLSLVS